MLTLTEAQLAGAKSYLEQSKTPREWILDNGLTLAEIKPGEVFSQLRERYTAEVIAPLRRAMAQGNIALRIDLITTNTLVRPDITVEICDSFIAKLSTAQALFEAKKAELQA